MFELYEIGRNSNFNKHHFREKVLPVMVEFIDFANPAIIKYYLPFWENEFNVWNDLVKQFGQLSIEQLQRYDNIKMRFQNFGRLTDWIIDMNALNLKILSADNFAEIRNEIIKRSTDVALQEPKPEKGLIKMLTFGSQQL